MSAVPVYVYAVFAFLFFAMAVWVMNRAKLNREQMLEDSGPAVAGSDSIAGAAADTGQFNNPDDDALDEMGELLEEAAEAQGLEYSE